VEARLEFRDTGAFLGRAFLSGDGADGSRFMTCGAAGCFF